MKIYYDKENKKLSKRFSGKVRDLLKLLNINPETVIVAKDGILVTEEDTLSDKDNIKIMSVISGG